MPKRKIVFLGNCQALALHSLYTRHLAFDQNDTSFYIDSIKPFSDADAGALATADVLVTQIFDFPTKFSPEMIGRGCKVLRFPSVIAGFYWPYASQPHVRSPRDGGYDPYAAQTGDRFLNGLINQNVDPATALQMYLELDIVKAAGLDRLFELNIAQQRKRDQRSGLTIAPLIEKRFRDEPLFLTPDHPNLSVFWAYAEGVFAELGASTAQIRDVKGMVDRTPFPDAALPIHPKIAAHFGLRFASADTRYRYYDEGDFTFEEFVLRYMKFEWNADLREGLHGGVGDLARRIEILDRGLAKSPESALGWRVRADLMLRSGRRKEAVEASGRALSLAPDDPETWATHYRAASEIGDWAAAGSTVQQAVQKFPHSSAVKRIETEYAMHRGEPARALVLAREVVRLASGDAHAHGFASAIAARCERYDEAILRAETAVELAPAENHFALHLANVLESAGRMDEAERLLRWMIESGRSDSNVYARLGERELNKGALEAARDHLQRAVELDGENIHARRLLSFAFERRGEFEQAKSVVADLLEQFASDAHLHSHMGNLHLRTQDALAARGSFETAVRLDGKTAWFQKGLAHALELLGELEEARRIIDGIVERGEADSHIFIHQAHLFERYEDFPSAEAAYRKGIAMSRGEWGFFLAFANLLERLGRSAEAVSTIEQGMDANPGNTELRVRLDQLRQAHALK